MPAGSTREKEVVMGSVQYRVSAGKGKEAVDGPDDADTVITIAASDATMDPSVAYMRGKLKAEGSTGALIAELASGNAKKTIARLSAQLA